MVVLDRKIVLELPASDRDTTGGPAAGLGIVESHILFAAKDDTAARSQLMSGREDTAALTTWTVNWFSGVDNRWRVKYEGQTYRVLGVVERGRRQFLDLLCEGIK